MASVRTVLVERNPNDVERTLNPPRERFIFDKDAMARYNATLSISFLAWD
ncbi:MAG: hypothetical protein V4568_07635 [Pseudomonadota bacterium]